MSSLGAATFRPRRGVLQIRALRPAQCSLPPGRGPEGVRAGASLFFQDAIAGNAEAGESSIMAPCRRLGNGDPSSPDQKAFGDDLEILRLESLAEPRGEDLARLTAGARVPKRFSKRCARVSLTATRRASRSLIKKTASGIRSKSSIRWKEAVRGGRRAPRPDQARSRRPRRNLCWFSIPGLAFSIKAQDVQMSEQAEPRL